jgi:hypothetical protein
MYQDQTLCGKLFTSPINVILGGGGKCDDQNKGVMSHRAFDFLDFQVKKRSSNAQQGGGQILQLPT